MCCFGYDYRLKKNNAYLHLFFYLKLISHWCIYYYFLPILMQMQQHLCFLPLLLFLVFYLSFFRSFFLFWLFCNQLKNELNIDQDEGCQDYQISISTKSDGFKKIKVRDLFHTEVLLRYAMEHSVKIRVGNKMFDCGAFSRLSSMNICSY